MSGRPIVRRSEEHTSELQSRQYLVCRLLLEKKKNVPAARTIAGDSLCCGGPSGQLRARPRACLRRVDRRRGSTDYEDERPFIFFFFNDTGPTEIYTLSLPDALPISPCRTFSGAGVTCRSNGKETFSVAGRASSDRTSPNLQPRENSCRRSCIKK